MSSVRMLTICSAMVRVLLLIKALGGQRRGDTSSDGSGAQAQLPDPALEAPLGEFEPLHHQVQVSLALVEAAGDLLGAQVAHGAQAGAAINEHVERGAGDAQPLG